MRTVALVSFGLLYAAAAASACSAFTAADDDDRDTPREDATADSSDATGAVAEGGDAEAGVLRDKLVFVTDTEMNGDFNKGGQVVCNEEGRASKPSSTFVPWLSLTGNAINRLTEDGIWKLHGGELVFPSRAAITSGSLDHTIDQNALGKSINEATYAWTNTNADGTRAKSAAAETCNDFQVGDAPSTAVAGRPAAVARDSTWTNHSARSCGMTAALICFEL